MPSATRLPLVVRSAPTMITLTTDFGPDSPYVAQMKGVILGIHPAATIVDITHSVAPQNIHEGAWVLAETVRAFPPTTVHVVVVDPGVGSQRRILGCEFPGMQVILPDNGLISRLLQEIRPRQLVEICEPKYWRHPVSCTFHGRDIMAPVAAHLDLGVPLRDVGPRPVDNPILLDLPLPRPTDVGCEGRIAYCDSFGNLISNIPSQMLGPLGHPSTLEVWVGDRQVTGIAAHYAAVPSGALMALIGSAGYLEVALRDGSAARTLGLGPGTTIRVARSVPIPRP